jgi:acyl carrier protein
MNSRLAEAVRSFVAEERGMKLKKVRMDSRLEEDLGMTGDDAAEFMEKFQEQFNVDLSGFEFNKHFGPEGFNPFWLIQKPAWLANHGKYPVTVEHLVRVVEAKEWICPPMAST